MANIIKIAFFSFLTILPPRDVRRFKDVRKEFERGSECLEGALVRNAQALRGKPHEVEEASNALLNARRTFRSEALDYVLEVRTNTGWSENTKILLYFVGLLEKKRFTLDDWWTKY